MMRMAPEPTLREEFEARLEAVLAIEPPERHAFLRKFCELCCDISDKIRSCGRRLRDCNVILARTNDRMARFLATEAGDG